MAELGLSSGRILGSIGNSEEGTLKVKSEVNLPPFFLEREEEDVVSDQPPEKIKDAGGDVISAEVVEEWDGFFLGHISVNDESGSHLTFVGRDEAEGDGQQLVCNTVS